MKFLIFVFKHRFRRNSLNNIINSKKNKDIRIINLSGPILSYIGMILYFILRNKKFTFISCDGAFFLKNEKKCS